MFLYFFKPGLQPKITDIIQDKGKVNVFWEWQGFGNGKALLILVDVFQYSLGDLSVFSFWVQLQISLQLFFGPIEVL